MRTRSGFKTAGRRAAIWNIGYRRRTSFVKSSNGEEERRSEVRLVPAMEVGQAGGREWPRRKRKTEGWIGSLDRWPLGGNDRVEARPAPVHATGACLVYDSSADVIKGRARAGSASGSSIQKGLPSPRIEITPTSPFIFSTALLTMLRPIPVPSKSALLCARSKTRNNLVRSTSPIPTPLRCACRAGR